MEHGDQPLPIKISSLGGLALQCRSYAKALHYKEQEFKENAKMNKTMNSALTGSLISLNTLLGQRGAAYGILKYVKQHQTVAELDEEWYEKLGRWEEALASYAAKASWNMKEWEKMEKYVNYLETTNEKTIDGSFLSALLNIQKRDDQMALFYISRARNLLETELKSLVGESYQRAYNHLITVQQLSEMEEIIELRHLKNTPEGIERCQIILAMWRKRLKGCQRSIDVWQRLLQLRSIVVGPLEDRWAWIKFSAICRQGGQLRLARKIFHTILVEKIQILDSITKDENNEGFYELPTDVTFAYLKQQ